MRIPPKQTRMEWRRWFAWHPGIIDSVTIWFERIERKRDPDIFDWAYSYRLIDQKDKRFLRGLWSRRRLSDGRKSP
jgi:hypothetical protein